MSDLYTRLAQLIHNCEPAKVTREQRQRAKRWLLEQQYRTAQPLLGNNTDLVVWDEADELCPDSNRQP